MTTFAYGIQEQNFFELVKKMNQFSEKNNVFATQVFPKPDEDFWYALIYFDNENKKPFYSSPAEPTTEITATESQINLLKKLKYKGNLNISKKEAFTILNRLLPKKEK